MTLTERIQALSSLGAYIRSQTEDVWPHVIEQSIVENPWFTPDSVAFALERVAEDYLDENRLQSWVSNYNIEVEKEGRVKKKVGLILAGNIPMVGIHDIISVFVSGHIACIKYSSKDKVLIKHLIHHLCQVNDGCVEYFKEVERLKDIDAVIATGGSTAATHFEYYFSKYPHIIRKNRSSVAILTGNETREQLKALGKDIFTYFGLGCRNVSKLYVPNGYKFDTFFESIIDYRSVIDHNKYKNNYDYTNAIYILGQHPFLTNNFLIVKEDKLLNSRISCVHHETYTDLNVLKNELTEAQEELQCIASVHPVGLKNNVRFGWCQHPALDDYADGVDTLAFLTQLPDY